MASEEKPQFLAQFEENKKEGKDALKFVHTFTKKHGAKKEKVKGLVDGMMTRAQILETGGLKMADFATEQKAFEVADVLIADSESAFGHPRKEEGDPKFPALNRYYFVYTTVTKRKIKETEERVH